MLTIHLTDDTQVRYQSYSDIIQCINSISFTKYKSATSVLWIYQLVLPPLQLIFYQCLPDDASLERSGDVDFYYMTRPEFTWLVGMKPVEGTEFYFRHFSRFYDENVVAKEITFGVTYKYSLGISDPTIFDKDLSVCVEAPLGQQSY
ncbi:hypothetical protein ElyMa_001866800 [Elysia marginata]|uniref:Uncharacterized protein n=1 Tax=Elysia marginata TaxID=1093978 RepID=A0AAV4EPC6_9GAST|nr:hypothetical protein ElyMa_001866800 [Elysia marginata]